MVSIDSDATSSSSKKPKEKLMHNFMSAMEHLLPIGNDKNHETSTEHQHSNALNTFEKSNSFLNNLNSILQTGHSSNNYHENTQSDVDIFNAKQRIRPDINFTSLDNRKSIFSDTEFELNHNPKTAYTNNDSSSSTKENSIKSIGFLHVNKSPVNYESDDDIGEIQEEEDPNLEITDDYIITSQPLKEENQTKSNSTSGFKLSTPQRSVSDVPKRALTMSESEAKSSSYNSGSKTRNTKHKLKPFCSSGQSSDNNRESTNDKNPSKIRRSGTISLAPLGMTKLKNRLRTESISKKDILEGNARSKNNSSNCLMALNRTKSDTPTTGSAKSTSSDNDKDNNSSSANSAENKSTVKEEVFSCALQKDILIQGKLTLNSDHLNFKSKIFGIKTDIDINIKDIVQLEKKTTAMVFPNGIIVKTLDKSYTFASFLNRDSVFEKIMEIWSDSIMSGIHNDSPSKKSRPKLPNKRSSSKSKNITFKVPEIFNGDGDALKLKAPVKKMIHGIIDSSSEDEDYDASSDRIDSDRSEDDSMQSDDDEEDEEDDDDDDMTTDEEYEEEDNSKESSSSNENNKGFGPDKGKKYEPNLDSYSKETDVADYTIKNTTLGKVFKIISDKMYDLLEKGGNNKISEVPKIYDEDDNGEKLKDGHYKREYSYTKPLNSSLGPKETKCMVKDLLEKVDLSKYFIIKQITETPDVPSGKSFHVITNIIFFWSGEDTVQIRAFTKVVWTGKSWIKGPVESGNTSGQKASMESLADEIQNFNDSNDQTSSSSNATAGKSKKKSKSSKKSKKSGSKEKLQADQEEKTEEPDSGNGMISTITGLLPDFKSMSQYLTWLIIVYLIIDRYRTNSSISKHLKLQNKTLEKETQISEAEVWDWVLKRSTKDRVQYENILDLKSNNNTELTKFNKQELYILRQLKQRELDALNGLLT